MTLFELVDQLRADPESVRVTEEKLEIKVYTPGSEKTYEVDFVDFNYPHKQVSIICKWSITSGQ